MSGSVKELRSLIGNMRFGMPTLIEITDLKQTVKLCQELGLNFIELNMNMPQFCPESIDSSQLKRISRETGIDFTIHLPDETDLASFHDSMRLGHIERCKEAIIWAAKSGIRLINLHINNGVYFTLPDRRVYIYAANSALFTERVVHSFTELYQLAQQRGVELCVENCADFGIKHIAETVELLLQKGLVKLTWDLGHDAISGSCDCKFIKAHIGDLIHMHLHDWDGRYDHQIPFSGKINIQERLQIAMDNKLSVVIEVKTIDALRESVRRLKM